MELFQSDSTKLNTYFREAILNNNCELEFIYGSHPRENPITQTEFIRLLSSIRQKYKNISESSTLDISLSDLEQYSPVRVSIHGLENIKRYCRSDSLDEITDITYMEKQNYINPKFPSVVFRPIVDFNYNFRINIKSEEYLEVNDNVVQNILSAWKYSKKKFRYKKRYSFITNDNLFRIDLTSVKSTNYKESFKSFLESNILKNKESYELEIEYIGSNKINDEFPIDKFKEKFYADKENIEKELSDKFKAVATDWDTTINTGENTFSELVIPDVAPFEDDYDIPKGITKEDEFSDERVLAHLSDKRVMDDYSFEDVKYEYWVDSDKEWLFDAILTYDKTLSYVSRKNNFTGDYENAPENKDYIEYRIFPKFTNEEIEQIKEIDDKFKYNLFIPEDQIVKITKYVKSVSWGPHKMKNKTEVRDEVLKEEISEVARNTEWVPEQYIYNKETPILTFDELVEAGEFDEEIKLQENVNAYKMKNAEKIEINDIASGMSDLFIKNIADLLKLKQNTNTLIRKNIQDDIINEYRILTSQEDNEYLKKKKQYLKSEERKKNTDNIKRLKREINRLKVSTTNFMGPNPVSMSLDNLDPKNKYSIVEKYVVTEKADGIRCQLFIGKDRYGYLITQKMKIIPTNIRFLDVPGTWLFDGEYITKNKENEDINLFMIFDIYYAGDGHSKYPGDAHNYPWIGKNKEDTCRYNILLDFKKSVDAVYEENSIRFDYKNYLEGPKKLQQSKKDPNKYSNISGIFKQSNKILELSKKGGFEYDIDGLIFMPMYQSVRGSDENPYGYINGEWSINYKWKPPEENTIDFRIRTVKEEIKGVQKDKIISSKVNGKTIICKQVHLYVGYNVRSDKDKDFTIDILLNQRSKSLNEILFNPEKENKTLYVCNIPLKNGKMLCEKDKSEILNGNLVEMRYNPTSDEMRWTPLRVRTDKMGSDGGRAQFFIIANKIWKTIVNPVTNNIIKGLEDYDPVINKDKLDDYSYYIGADMESKQDESLRKLHNYIKSKLISAICSIGSEKISIMDTSIGRGGDLKKYLYSKNPIEFLLALDISPDIKKATHIYHMEGQNKPRTLFIQYDTSESISNGSGFKGTDSEIARNKQLINIVYDKRQKIDKEYNEIEKQYRGIAKRGFNIISSQFSFHYYFKDELTLRGYLKNLSDNCIRGGYFIGTCYDGKKVFDELQYWKTGEKNKIEMNDSFGNKVYSIEKQYEIDNFDYKKDNKGNMFGQVINVYMSSIGKEFPEYLVNFDMLEDIMKEYRFKLHLPNLRGINSGIFDSQKYSIKKGLGSFSQIINNLNKLSEKDILIKKNRSNNLIKGPFYKALEINNQENELLKILSGFNNWFIFQKY